VAASDADRLPGSGWSAPLTTSQLTGVSGAIEKKFNDPRHFHY
jgi:hypothetical protein